jgi:hypothetical protein
MRQLQLLRCYLHAKLGRAGKVAARSAKADNKADLHRIARRGEDNRSCRGRRLHRQHRRGIADDHSHLTTNQLSRHCWQPVVLPVRPAVFDRHILALDIAGFLQALTEGRHIGCVPARRCAVEESDHWHRRLLRPRRERPRRRAAKPCDELPPPHQSCLRAAKRSAYPSRGLMSGPWTIVS